MGQGSDSVTVVIRPTTKLTEAQARLLAEAEEAVRKARAAEDAAWGKIRGAREAGVPDPMLCARTDIPRSTLNRRLGSKRQSAKQSPTTSSFGHP